MCRLEQLLKRLSQALWQRLIGNNYLAAFFRSFLKLRCVMYSLFVCFSLFYLSFCYFLRCFLFCEYLCVLCVLSTYVLCVFAPQLPPLFNFLYHCGENYLYAHNLCFLPDPIHERTF